MVFSSSLFIMLFLPLFLGAYYIAEKTKKIKIKNAVVLMASFIFYAWGGVKYLIIVILLVLTNYLFALAMERDFLHKKVILFICIAVNLLSLGYFKYFNFLYNNFSTLATMIMPNIVWEDKTNIVLPIGISFYTFQTMSYVIDVYRGEVKPQKSFFDLLMYVIMFPQLIAGPIVRYQDVNKGIISRTSSMKDVYLGMKRFVIGFAKKVFIANAMGGVADIMFSQYMNVGTLYAWIGAICYTLQIFYDFSAYSDMAIGLGRVIGFRFNENFDSPYTSKSIKEFWRRWHISLSSWFRDYVYIPLGGNQKEVARTYLNLLIVFFLTGLWHGAAWQFIVWGMFHGLFLLIERTKFGNVLRCIPTFFQHLYCMVIVIIGWVFFRADNISIAISYIRKMFTFNFNKCVIGEITGYVSPLTISCFIIGILGVLPFARKLYLSTVEKNSVVINTFYFVIYIWAILYMVGLSYNPFIYFKF